MESIFVIIAHTGALPQLHLNLMQSWCSLIFECLPESTMKLWHPEGNVRAGYNLNVAHPLLKGVIFSEAGVLYVQGEKALQ